MNFSFVNLVIIMVLYVFPVLNVQHFKLPFFKIESDTLQISSIFWRTISILISAQDLLQSNPDIQTILSALPTTIHMVLSHQTMVVFRVGWRGKDQKYKL